MRCVRLVTSVCWIATLLSILCVGQVNAAVQASVDHDHVAVGGTVLLSISSDGDAEPDLSPLAADFDVQGRSSSSQTSIVNGRSSSRHGWTIAMAPRRSGALQIPALTVGSEHTDPIVLNVTELPTPAKGDNSPVFIDSTLDDRNPYVQQSLIYTVRLYYTLTLLDASLDVAPSDGFELRRIGDDTPGSAVVDGRRYNVLARSYVLTPERSGKLQVPVPSFRGRAVSDGFDGMLDGNPVAARGKPITLDVRARPSSSVEPWLPAQSIALAVEPPTQPLHAGEPFTVSIKLSGTGVTAAQLPDPQLPQIAGAQIYPEASSFQDSVRDGQLQAERTRRFAIVPNAAGSLRLPPVVQAWWDVRHDRAEQARATLPALQVLPGSVPTGAGDTTATATGGVAGATSNGSSTVGNWIVATILLALGWFATAIWAWRRLRNRSRAIAATDATGAASDNASKATRHGPTLMRALALGDLDAIASALLDAAPGPRAQHLAQVAERLDEAAQAEAVHALDAARWGNGDTAPALAALRAAFAHPPQWRNQRIPGRSSNDILPPLYPR